MPDCLSIYVTGDAGTDVFACAEEGGHTARPTRQDRGADTSHDLYVPSGANFTATVLKELLEPNAPYRTQVKVIQLTSDCTTGHGLDATYPILTDIRKYTK